MTADDWKAIREIVAVIDGAVNSHHAAGNRPMNRAYQIADERIAAKTGERR